MTDSYFDEGLLDLKLLIDDFGADYVWRHFQQVYPSEASQLKTAVSVSIQYNKIPILLQKKKT